MSLNTPIYRIAKELDIDNKRIILACKTLGINAKGSTKRLNEEEFKKVKNYFLTGKNVSEEIVEINKNQTSEKNITVTKKTEETLKYFPNRLIAKS